jgi:hypothetical protein
MLKSNIFQEVLSKLQCTDVSQKWSRSVLSKQNCDVDKTKGMTSDIFSIGHLRHYTGKNLFVSLNEETLIPDRNSIQNTWNTVQA